MLLLQTKNTRRPQMSGNFCLDAPFLSVQIVKSNKVSQKLPYAGQLVSFRLSIFICSLVQTRVYRVNNNDNGENNHCMCCCKGCTSA